LAAWLRDPAQEELVRDKRVLELGCGCGLPGIAYYLFNLLFI
jgi:predicted nicotinamide N-methyase